MCTELSNAEKTPKFRVSTPVSTFEFRVPRNWRSKVESRWSKLESSVFFPELSSRVESSEPALFLQLSEVRCFFRNFRTASKVRKWHYLLNFRKFGVFPELSNGVESSKLALVALIFESSELSRVWRNFKKKLENA